MRMKKRYFLILTVIISSCAYFYDDTDYSFIEEPYFGEYKKILPYENCPESVILLNDSIYVRKLSCTDVVVIDTAMYKFFTRPKSEGLNKMGIRFKNWRFLYHELSYMPMGGDSTGDYSLFYTVENDKLAKLVILADNRSLDYVLELHRGK